MGFHTEKPELIKSAIAAGAITKRRFISHANVVCGTLGMLAKGVSRETDTDSGKSFAVVVQGTALVEAGEALVKGDKVTTSALGKAVKAASTNVINGTVLVDQAEVGQPVEILLSNSASEEA